MKWEAKKAKLTSCEPGIANLSVENHDFGSELTVIPMSEDCNNLAHLCSYVCIVHARSDRKLGLYLIFR